MTNTEEREKMWGHVLFFLSGEWFGEEFVSEYLHYKYEGDTINQGEEVINVELKGHEKNFWNFLDALFKYLQKNRKKMPAGELEEKIKMSVGLKSLFWATLKLNHPELMEAEDIGIRDGYLIVKQQPPPPGPFLKMFRPSGPQG